MNNNYSEALAKAKKIFADDSLIKQDGFLLDCPLEEIAGNDVTDTVKKQIIIAEGIIGVPLLCSIEKQNNLNYFTFKNLKTGTLIDRKLWHLPIRLKNISYSFMVVWVDGSRGEFYPGESKAIVISKIN